MSAARSFLVALQLDGRPCLVVGSGPEAARRGRDLADAGAEVVVVGPEPSPELELLASSGRLSLERRAFSLADLDLPWLVVLADRDPQLAKQLGAACRERRLLFCAVDQPGENGFHHLAIVRAGELTLGISSEGRAPALAKRLQSELGRALAEADVESFLEHLAELRQRTPPERRKDVLTLEASRLVVSGIEIRPRDEGTKP